MKSSMFALLLCLAAAPPASAAAAGAKGKENPLGEVIVLLDSLAAKVTADGEAEAKAYKEYFEWCDDASKTKGFEIKTASSTKESLEATISKEAAIVSGATLKIEELAAAIAADEAELKQATEIREKEAADFKSEEAELVDVVGTLERAIAIVEKEMAKKPCRPRAGRYLELGPLAAVVEHCCERGGLLEQRPAEAGRLGAVPAGRSHGRGRHGSASSNCLQDP
jgi:hypothetical protein